MAYLLLGYDVENYLGSDRNLDPRMTVNFIRQLKKVHEDLSAPCTLFICGRLLEDSDILEALQSLKESQELFDLQQHTYSHQRLKTVVRDDGKAITVFKGASIEKIREDIARAQQVFVERLKINCSGICGPYGYYRGLMDRPDLLDILYENGIRFTRTYLRNEKDHIPLSINVQPFYYGPQGFPEILEIPSQGWMDIYYFRVHGWNRESFLKYGKEMIDLILKKNLTWSVCLHDYTTCYKDPTMEYTRSLIAYAQSNNVIVTSHLDYARRSHMGDL